mgnify:CR=1 FL=1
MRNQHITKKRFFAEVAAVILGKKQRFSVTVPAGKKRALQEVLSATNMLYQTLQRNDSDLDSVIPIIEKKGILAKNFEKEFGFPWVL